MSVIMCFPLQIVSLNISSKYDHEVQIKVKKKEKEKGMLFPYMP